MLPQAQQAQWARINIGLSTYWTMTHSIARDGAGAYYSTGSHNSNLSLLSGSGSLPGGNNDQYIVKSTPNGYYRWAHRINTNGNSNLQVTKIKVDAQANLYLSGSFTNTISAPGFSATATGADDELFVLSYDSAGNYRWGFSANAGGDSYADEIEILSNGNLLLQLRSFGPLTLTTGTVIGGNQNIPNNTLVELNPTTGAVILQTPFILGPGEFDSGVECIWPLPGGGFQALLIIDSATTFGGHLFSLPDDGPQRFWVECNAAHQVMLTHGLGMNAAGFLEGHARSSSGELYLVFWANYAAVYFDGQWLPPGPEGVLFKLSSSGQMQWGRRFGGVGNYFTRANDVILDGSGNPVVVAGNPLPATHGSITLPADFSDYNAVVYKFDPAGNALSAVASSSDASCNFCSSEFFSLTSAGGNSFVGVGMAYDGVHFGNGVSLNPTTPAGIYVKFDEVPVMLPVVTYGGGPNLCPGNTVTASIGVVSGLLPGNQFQIQLSNATGSFANPVVIGSVTNSTGPVTVTGTIPPGLPGGSGYRIRLVTTNPFTIAIDNGVNLSINSPAVVNLGASPLCLAAGASQTLNAGAGYSTYAWSTGASSQSITISSPGTYSVTVTQAGFSCPAVSAPLNVVNAPLPPQLQRTPGDSTCAGQLISLSVPGNWVTLLWNDGFPQIYSRGFYWGNDYWVTVTDAQGCTINSDTAHLYWHTIQPPVITPPAPVRCPAGFVTLDAGPGYDAYEWGPFDHNQTFDAYYSGLYSCMVTDTVGGVACSATASVNVTNAQPVYILPGTWAYYCPGDSVELSVPPGYSPQWSTGENTPSIWVSTPQSVTVTATDAGGCVTQFTTSVAPYSSPPHISVNPGTAICPGDSTSLAVSGGGTNLNWSTGQSSNSIFVSQAGLYTVTGNFGTNCTFADSVYIIVHPAPVAPTLSIVGLDLVTQSGFVTYVWKRVGFGNGYNGTNVFTPIVNGDFYVLVTDSNGCTVSSDTLSYTLSRDELSDQPEMEMRPHPAQAHSVLVVPLELQFHKLKLCDAQGRPLMEWNRQWTEVQALPAAFHQLSSGVYLIQGLNEEGEPLAQLRVVKGPY